MHVGAAYAIDRRRQRKRAEQCHGHRRAYQSGRACGAQAKRRNPEQRGVDVTAQGSVTAANRNAARIYGFPATDIGEGNFALATMSIEVDASYATFVPSTRDPAPNLAGPDGQNASASAFRGRNGMGFTAPTWNFIGVSRGFPHLAWQ